MRKEYPSLKKKLDKHWPLQAAAYFHSGIGPEAMAKAFGISLRSFREYCRRFPEFARAAETGRLDDPVEEALLRRAIGFKQTETVCEDIIDRGSGEITGNCKKRTVVKEVPPDIRALLFWLKNRRPDRWKEKNDSPETDPELEFDELDSAL